jgi:anaerobic magnesium-protoporphyrin IX monomethyl ester cyclase
MAKSDVVLVYPNFLHGLSKAILINNLYPPLGIGYLASVVRKVGLSVAIVDCTNLTMEHALAEIRKSQPRILGIYSNLKLHDYVVQFAKALRNEIEFLVTGGPLPTLAPETYVDLFDVVVIGEGEITFQELVQAVLKGEDWRTVEGIAYLNPESPRQVLRTKPRKLIQNLDAIPFPARDLFPNQRYKRLTKHAIGSTVTTMITGRGCLYHCDFCSDPVHKRTYRPRNPQRIVDEMKVIKDMGYDSIWFADNTSTLIPKQIEQICDLIIEQNVDINWGINSRVDQFSYKLAKKLAKAGCKEVLFGLEAGNNQILKIMKKGTTVEQNHHAVEAASKANLKVCGEFILGYPGESNKTLLDTINFSSQLPLNTLIYNLPVPIRGTGLYKKYGSKIRTSRWGTRIRPVADYEIYRYYNLDFSKYKMYFGSLKGHIQHKLRKQGGRGHILATIFQIITDKIMTFLR